MRKIAIAVSLALSAGGLTGILLANASAQTSPWHVVIVHKGQTTAYDIQADSRANAASQAWSRYIGESSVSAASGTTTTSTTSTSSTTTSTTSTTSTSTTTVPPGNGYPVISPPYAFNGGFDPDCQLLGGNGGWDSNVSGSDHPGTASIEHGTVEEGNCSARFSTPGGSGTGRAEVARQSVSAPTLIDYEYLEFVPSPANNGPGHGVLQQTKQGGSGGGCFNGGLTKDNSTQQLNFSTVGSCSAGSNKHNLGPVPYDHWFAVRTIERFADAGHVTVQIDADGTGPGGYVTKLNVDTDTLSGDGVKLRQGLYHDEDSHESHVFGDGFHVAG